MAEFHNFLKTQEGKVKLAEVITIGVQKQLKESWVRNFCHTTNLPDGSLSVFDINGKTAYYIDRNAEVQKSGILKQRIMVPIIEIASRLSFSMTEIRQFPDEYFWNTIHSKTKFFEEQETKCVISLINALIRDSEREIVSENFSSGHKIEIPGIRNLGLIESLEKGEKFVADDLNIQLMVRMDLTCLNADDPDMRMLGYAFFEQIGICLLEHDDCHIFVSKEAHKRKQLNKMRFVMNELETV